MLIKSTLVPNGLPCWRLHFTCQPLCFPIKCFLIWDLFFEGDMFFLLVGVLWGFAGFFCQPFGKIGLAYKQIKRHQQRKVKLCDCDPCKTPPKGAWGPLRGMQHGSKADLGHTVGLLSCPQDCGCRPKGHCSGFR